MNYQDIIKSIEDKNTEPIYFLIGEESYYIDKICEEFTKNLIKKEEKEFNQITLYGKETTTDQIIAECKQFPFGSERRLVIVKEAQLIKNIESLDSYFENPQTTTTLVIAYKKKSIDKRKKFGKNITKRCVLFESMRIYDNKMPTWITDYLNTRGFKIEHSATAILSEHIGSNLSRMANELEKLMLIIKKDELISKEHIEKNIGISKDFNIFELQNVIGQREIVKTNRIIEYFSKNTKEYHIVTIIGGLFSFFQKVLTYHFLKDKTQKSIANNLRINPFFVKQYQIAANNYDKKQIFTIIGYLNEYDLKSKGVKNKSTNQRGLLRELIFKILHT